MQAMTAGFNSAKATLGRSEISFNGQTWIGVSSQEISSQELQEAGYLEMGDKQFDLSTEDFGASGIVDRSRVKVDGSNYKVIGIQKATHSPIVHLLLKIDR